MKSFKDEFKTKLQSTLQEKELLLANQVCKFYYTM